ncbi:unnamed protein product, partial [Ectocarpus sp. 6 AP-2014]
PLEGGGAYWRPLGRVKRGQLFTLDSSGMLLAQGTALCARCWYHTPQPTTCGVSIVWEATAGNHTHPTAVCHTIKLGNNNLPTDLATGPAALLAGVGLCALDWHASSVTCAA